MNWEGPSLYSAAQMPSNREAQIFLLGFKTETGGSSLEEETRHQLSWKANFNPRDVRILKFYRAWEMKRCSQWEGEDELKANTSVYLNLIW